MKMTVITTLFEHVLENLLGYEGLFYMLHDDPELVARVFARWGHKVYDFYRSVVGMEQVGAIFHADDLGFNTSTLLSPRALRQYVFPWLKQYAALAHEHGKTFWYHCCGNVYSAGVIEDLVDDVRIDAFHSFQDVILPVADFKVRYGHRVSALGGVDMDKLARLDPADLRDYVRGILARCAPGGRFALGSGNTVANYVPLRNYCLMLEESRRWRPPA
jgi:uroporphyrinogen decarboxylase